MNRRDFIKQSAVVTAGMVLGAKFPGVIGVDKLTPGSDQTVTFLVGYSDQLKTPIYKQGSMEELMEFYTKAVAATFAVPVKILKDS